MRIALGIEYDGAAFSGWQTQSDRHGVQDAVESALAQVAGTPIATICAGRTDSGVHALDQVIHFDTDAARPTTAWVRGVNRFLPASIAVQWARPVGADFHARYGARRRRYDYWILNAPARSAASARTRGLGFPSARRSRDAARGNASDRPPRFHLLPISRVPGGDAGAGR